MSVYSDYSGKAASVEQRIYQLAVHSDSSETISTTTLQPPKYIPRAPRIRILLAPYMSPYVVQVHKVRTWDALHRTIHNLFGDHVFQDSPRITDQQGQTIFPDQWKNLVQPNMTIIVDTCSYVPDDSPTTFQGQLPPSRGYTGMRRHRKKASNQSIDEKLSSVGKFESVAALILADRKSQDSSFFTPEPLSPVNNEPVLNTRPMEPWEGWSKDSPQLPMNELKLEKSHDALRRQTSVTMFSGLKAENKPTIVNFTSTNAERMERKGSKRSLGLGRKTSKQSLRVERKSSKRVAPSAAPITERKPVLETQTYPNITAVIDNKPGPPPLTDKISSSSPPRPSPPSGPPKKSRWGKVSKTLLFVLSRGMSDPKPLPGTPSLRAAASSQLPAVKQENPSRSPRSAPAEGSTPLRLGERRRSHEITRTPQRTLSKRQRPSPLQSSSPESRPRSRSFGSIPSSPAAVGLGHSQDHGHGHKTSISSAPVNTIQPLTRPSPPKRSDSTKNPPTFPKRSDSLLHRPTRSAPRPSQPLTRKPSKISPPVPPRPAEDLGTNAQFIQPTLTKPEIVEIRTRKRAGTGSSSGGGGGGGGGGVAMSRSGTQDSANMSIVPSVLSRRDSSEMQPVRMIYSAFPPPPSRERTAAAYRY